MRIENMLIYVAHYSPTCIITGSIGKGLARHYFLTSQTTIVCETESKKSQL